MVVCTYFHWRFSSSSIGILQADFCIGIPVGKEDGFRNWFNVKFIYSEKATKFSEISTLLLTTVHTVKSKVEISQNFVVFSEYMNFIGTELKLRRGFPV